MLCKLSHPSHTLTTDWLKAGQVTGILISDWLKADPSGAHAAVKKGAKLGGTAQDCTA